MLIDKWQNSILNKPFIYCFVDSHTTLPEDCSRNTFLGDTYPNQQFWFEFFHWGIFDTSRRFSRVRRVKYIVAIYSWVAEGKIGLIIQNPWNTLIFQVQISALSSCYSFLLFCATRYPHFLSSTNTIVLQYLHTLCWLMLNFLADWRWLIPDVWLKSFLSL